MRRQETHQQDSTSITYSEGPGRGTPATTTLLDLITALQECTPNDTELVATVVFLINSGRVRLCGTFAGARIDVAPAAFGLISNHEMSPRERRGKTMDMT